MCQGVLYNTSIINYKPKLIYVLTAVLVNVMCIRTKERGYYMTLFKKVRCGMCKYQTTTSKPKTGVKCPKCGKQLLYGLNWSGSFNVNGVKYNRSLVPGREDSLVLLAQMIAESATGINNNDHITFADAAFSYLEWADGQVKLNLLADVSVKRSKQCLDNHLLPRWGGMKLVDFANRANLKVDKYRELRVGWAAPATINREVGVLKRVMSWCAENNYLRDNPLSGYSKLPEKKTRKTILTEGEIVKLRDSCDGHTRVLIEIGLQTGLRIEGALTLRWQEVDFKKNLITKVVKHHRSSGPMTVEIPLTDRLRRTLILYRGSQVVFGLSSYVCPSPKNYNAHMLSSSDWGLKTAFKRAGITGRSFHDLRHTFATRFLLATGDIHTLSKLMGHSNAYITERYSHMMDSHRDRLMDVFSNFDQGSQEESVL